MHSKIKIKIENKLEWGGKKIFSPECYLEDTTLRIVLNKLNELCINTLSGKIMIAALLPSIYKM